jgi:bacteriorhodopsin
MAPQSPWVYRTAVASLLVQLAVAIVTAAGLFLPLDEAVRADLEAILALELSTQVVELAWYTLAVCAAREIATWTRYADWAVSTPTMLVAAALFFQHRRGLALSALFESYVVYAVLALDWAMLALGYLVERERVPRVAGLAGGGAALVLAFALLARTLGPAPVDALSAWVFWAMYGVWALYGVAAALPDAPKNIAYNGLDLVSKNAFGALLFAYALQWPA